MIIELQPQIEPAYKNKAFRPVILEAKNGISSFALTRTEDGLSWKETLQTILPADYNMPNNFRVLAQIAQLKSGNPIYYADDRSKVDKRVTDSVLDEMLSVRNPYRGFHTDAYFTEEKGILVLQSNHRIVDGNIQHTYQDNLDPDTLMEDRLHGIDLEDLLQNSTPQGLARKNIKKGSLYFWHPRPDSVSWFDAYSGRAGLYCVGDSGDSNVRLGVYREKFLEQ